MPSAAEVVIRLAEERRLLGPETAAAVRARIQSSGDSPFPLVGALGSAGRLSSGAILPLLSEVFALPALAPAQLKPEPDALACVTRTAARRAGAIPLSRHGSVLRVAVGDPTCRWLEALAEESQSVLEMVLAPADAVELALDRNYAPVDVPVAATGAGAAPALAESEDIPIAKLVRQMVEDALCRRASDIHVEPLGGRLRFRLRIDGVLQEVGAPPSNVAPALVARLKLMAGMEIDEKRVPQDGRIQIVVEGRAVDLRVSCLPTIHGESLVLRVLETERLALDWAGLGLWPEDERALAGAVGAGDGLVLVTGPTGSGKTTTLYACLHRLNCTDRKIVTVEDPIEYRMTGINQVPVRPEIGMTFAAALRALLRQAPNVVMVGEIRDHETAEIAVNAAQTGHLVFSTLHTNDAAAAVVRLVDLGVRPYLLAAGLRAVVAQRLVRRVCPGCARTAVATEAELRALGHRADEFVGAKWRRGAGCGQCMGSGYRGRVGLYEILPVTDEIRQRIYDNVTASQLRSAARAVGMVTLREDGLRKTLAGWTTISEILAHTVSDSG